MPAPPTIAKEEIFFKKRNNIQRKKVDKKYSK
jgi:hypothetical protein